MKIHERLKDSDYFSKQQAVRNTVFCSTYKNPFVPKFIALKSRRTSKSMVLMSYLLNTQTATTQPKWNEALNYTLFEIKSK